MMVTFESSLELEGVAAGGRRTTLSTIISTVHPRNSYILFPDLLTPPAMHLAMLLGVVGGRCGAEII